MSEKDLISEIQLLYSKNGDRIFRQNVGQGWAGRFLKFPMATSVTVSPMDVVIKGARPLRAGLCTGSSDLIGWTTVTIGPEHLGKKLAVFTAIEAKYGTTPTTEEQSNFLKSVKLAGGFARICRNIQDIFELRAEL